MKFRSWVKLPTAWIEARGLRSFRWGRHGSGSSGISGLMVLMALGHRADADTGEVRATYDDIVAATGLSRTSVSGGLQALEGRSVVARVPGERSTYQLVGYDPQRGWGKLPARQLYRGGEIMAFRDFHLRRIAELDALKTYFAFVARRDDRKNLVLLSYKKIEHYTGVPRNRIKSALSMLSVHGLVFVEQVASDETPYAANAYRIAHLDARRHMGTTGRQGFVSTESEFIELNGDSDVL